MRSTPVGGNYGRGEARGYARSILGALTSLLVVLVSAIAYGQVQLDDQLRDAQGTPPRDTPYWERIAGARHPETGVPADSPTPFDSDLFAVRFRNSKTGFAGGSACDEGGAGECERVPVIYATSPETNGEWREVYRGDTAGYVGSIAWISKHRALAVGGTGAYPRREPSPPGEARAWLWEDGEWLELLELPAGMTGLTALDVWTGRDGGGLEWGLAGGAGQIWEWHGGTFTGRKIDRNSGISPDDPTWSVEGAERFQRRVREIRLAPDATKRRAIAVTAGCCGEGGAAQQVAFDSTRVERVDDQSLEVRDLPKWTVSDVPKNDAGAASEPDSPYSFVFKPSRSFNPPGAGYDPTLPDHGAWIWDLGQTTKAPGGPEPAPGGPGEPRFRLTGSDGDIERSGISTTPGAVLPAGVGVPDWRVGELRGTDEGAGSRGLLETTVEDLRPWYGGVQPGCAPPKPSSPGGSHQTVVLDELAIDLWPAATSDTGNIDRTAWICRVEQVQTGEDATVDERSPVSQRESGLQLAPSYRLNAVHMLDEEGVGYAVGDHGAVLRFGAPPADPPPAPVGKPREGALSDRAPYDAFRPPVPSRAGPVPPLEARPLMQLADPVMVAGGSPDGSNADRRYPIENVRQIVMSRDGAEGWAIGPSLDAAATSGARAVLTLYHYIGGSWRRCDPVGIPGVVEADPACAGLAPLVDPNASGSVQQPMPVQLTAAARVPLEHDGDASNDDDFEVVAVGTKWREPGLARDRFGMAPQDGPAIVRFRHGRWSIEPEEVRRSLRPQGALNQDSNLEGRELVFLSADDGWLKASGGGLFRFDGERWIDCQSSVNAEECSDPDHRLSDRVGANNTTGENATMAGADGRIYLGGARPGAQPGRTRGALILYKDAGDGAVWKSEAGGFDPAFGGKEASPGVVSSLAVARRSDGSYEGWAVGQFGGSVLNVPFTAANVDTGGGRALMRLEPDGEWRRFSDTGAVHDFLEKGLGLNPSFAYLAGANRQVMIPGESDEPGRTFIGIGTILGFNPFRSRFEFTERPGSLQSGAPVQALAGDGGGGFWAAVRTGGDLSQGRADSHFYRYTDRPHKEVFSEVAHPAADGRRLTALTGARDGTVWLGSESDTLFRYDRLAGWEPARVSGWDPGRIVTRTSRVNAIALGPDGEGVAVGEFGKIARIHADRVELDHAAGRRCNLAAPQPPCGTGNDLEAATIGPDGSAMAGGRNLALLWRPAGGEFRAIERPDASLSRTVTGIAMPAPGNAYLTLDSGQVFAGRLAGDRWSWQVENEIEVGGRDTLLSMGTGGAPLALRAIALRGDGTGFAVGDEGLILERTGDPGAPWRRVASGVTEELTSVALPPDGGEGGLIGGKDGLVLTLGGSQWSVARHGDPLRTGGGPVTGVALLPGVQEDQAEAWALVDPRREPGTVDGRPGLSRLLHFASDEDEPLLDPKQRGVEPLPDAPGPRPGELTFAAFGRSDCHNETRSTQCTALSGGDDGHELILRRVREALIDRARRSDQPLIALHTGDAHDTGGRSGDAVTHQRQTEVADFGVSFANFDLSPPGPVRFRRFAEYVFDRLYDRGVPVFGAIGGRDVAATRSCPTWPSGALLCADTRDNVRSGDNLAWRQGMASQLWPKGDDEELFALDGLRFEAIADRARARRHEDVEVEDPDGEDGSVHPMRAPTGGASTHYAVDIRREDDDAAVARLVVLDTSLRSLAAGDPIQQPLEPDGGQLTWVEQMLCFEGERRSAGGRCTRERGQAAIVLSNTPTYSYGPGAGTETQADGTALEDVLLRYGVSALVSGRLGWNGRYWATAAGIHQPCPGGSYSDMPPAPGTRVCDEAAPAAADPDTAPASATELANAVRGLAAPVAELPSEARVLPAVVSSSAGGRFGPDGAADGAASEGFWHGYSIVRVDASGDPRHTVVEQRPVFDWIGLTARHHVLRAGQRLTLVGVGREPIGAALGFAAVPGGRFDRIDSPAITHRYDLIEADPERPYLPRRNADGDYVPLDPRVATVDSQTGVVRAGRGRQSRAYAVGLLSVGERAATWPLVFEPARSFRPRPTTLVQAPGSIANAPVPRPPLALKVLSQPPAITPPNSAAPPVVPPFGLNIAAPTPPQLPQVAVPPGAAPIAAPPPPPAPPPPGADLQLGLTIEAPVSPISIVPTVIPPSPPPVNPAPPSGSAARKEARQRQAAAAKSEEKQQQEAQQLGGDLAQERDGASGSQTMSRLERGGSVNPVTRRPRDSQWSAWAQALAYGGGTALTAFVLALGWSACRPRPGRRTPAEGAPAWARRPRP